MKQRNSYVLYIILRQSNEFFVWLLIFDVEAQISLAPLSATTLWVTKDRRSWNTRKFYDNRWTSTSCSNLLYAEWFHNVPDFIHGFTMVFETTDFTVEWYKNHWGDCISRLNERIEPDRGICIIQDPHYANDSFRLILGFHDKLQATITISGPILDDFTCIWLWHVYQVNFLWWAIS